MSMTSVKVDNGKYEFRVGDGRFEILRHGEPWVAEFSAPGENAVFYLVHEAAALQERLASLCAAAEAFYDELTSDVGASFLLHRWSRTVPSLQAALAAEKAPDAKPLAAELQLLRQLREALICEPLSKVAEVLAELHKVCPRELPS